MFVIENVAITLCCSKKVVIFVVFFQADSAQISERHLYFNYVSRNIEKEECQPRPTEAYSKILYCELNCNLGWG